MFDDLTKEIKAQLYERARSPLTGTFVISWFAWNIRAIVALISDMSFQEKIDYWNSLYPLTSDIVISVFIGPLISASLFILLYPYPARWAFQFWYTQHKRLKEIQQKIEDKTPLTQEEANAIRRTALDQQAQLQSQLREISAGNKELSENNRMLLEEIARLKNERTQIDAVVRKLDEQLAQTKVLKQPQLPEMTQIGFREPKSKDQDKKEKDPVRSGKEGKNLFELLSEDVRNALISATGQLDPRVLNAFLGLIGFGGKATPQDIALALKVNPIEVRYGLDELASRELTSSFGGTYSLTERGREVAVRLKLTSMVPALNT